MVSMYSFKLTYQIKSCDSCPIRSNSIVCNINPNVRELTHLNEGRPADCPLREDAIMYIEEKDEII